ncbi:MAG: hypothetical protein KatS3mg035_2093 [Bacteroidia bacterium]|nr:MAG: hypothetical protein KatS3mg035_2093 [Bacteroidia bacterium]
MGISQEQEKERLTQNPGMLIIIRGIPGSGKSTLASSLIRELGEKALKIDPDMYRYKNTPSSIQHGENEETLFGNLANTALEALYSGKIVVWDQALTRLDENLVNRIKSVIWPIPIMLVEVETPESVAWQRIQKREKEGLQTGPYKEQFSALCKRYLPFQGTNTDIRIIRIQGDKSIEENIKQIYNVLNKDYF